MKIFGTRKRTSTSINDNNRSDQDKDAARDVHAAGEAPITTHSSAISSAQEEPVASYFSSQEVMDSTSTSNKKRKKEVLKDIEELLQMDYSRLNAKQRRLLKRHQEKKEEEEPKEAAEAKSHSDPLTATESQSEVGSGMPQEEREKSEGSGVLLSSGSDPSHGKSSQQHLVSDGEEKKIDEAETNQAQAKSSATTDMEEILKMKPSELNSKQRRLLKRYQERCGIRPSDEGNVSVVSGGKAQEKSGNSHNTSDSKSDAASNSETANKKAKNSKLKDLSHLPKEERERRERQRQLQIEAAERRANGLEDTSSKRHPLNSERRRANRRKPGKSGKIAEAKRKARSLGA